MAIVYMTIDSCKLTNASKLVTLAEMPISTCTLYVLSEYLPLNQFILRFKAISFVLLECV